MGLFRRIFGKTNENEDTQEVNQIQHTNNAKTENTISETEEEKPQSPPADEVEITELDTIEVNEVGNGELTNAAEAEAVEETDDAEDDIDPNTKPVATSPLPSSPRSIIDGATRPLTADQVYPDQEEILASESVSFGIASHVGMIRTNNQDAGQAMFVTGESSEEHPDFGLFVVADGMGGHQEGEKASAITARTITSDIIKTIYLPMFSGDEDVERIPITEALVSAVQKANNEVIKHVPEGGTTATIVTIIGDLAHFAHVGDSRAYLMTKNGVDQITRDHSLVQRLIELDQLTPEEAEDHPQKNVLYRALGQNETLEVDAMTRRLPANSRLLICSDGLWGLVEERDIYEITMNTPDPQQACEKLIAKANAKGGIDNITAIVVKISST